MATQTQLLTDGANTVTFRAGFDIATYIQGYGDGTEPVALQWNGGRVGIGTDVPATTLDVTGVITGSSTATLGANGGTGGQLTLNGATSGSAALRVAAAAGTGTIFQLPANNGTNTYVLQTNGSGVTSWVAPGGGGGAIDDLSDAETDYSSLNNMLLGSGAGGGSITSAEHNLGLGEGAQGALTTGDNNLAVGEGALLAMQAGGNNVAIGFNVLTGATVGGDNTAVGAFSMAGNVDGEFNVAIGSGALSGNAEGDQNIAVGLNAGDDISAGNQNIIIGYNVDAPDGTAGGQIVIGNLIFGTGATGTGTTISGGNIGIASNAPSYRLELPNTASSAGQGSANAWQTYSDGRFKKDLKPIADALAKVMALKGVTYRSALEVNAKREVGLIAQDVEKVLPEAVSVSNTEVVPPGEKPRKVTDYRSLAYDRLAALLVEAIKELKQFTDGVALKVEKLVAQVTGHDTAIKELKAANDNLRLELKAANDNYASGLKSLREVSTRQQAEIKELRTLLKAAPAR